MATQSVQPTQSNSPHLEASLEAESNPTQDFGTHIRGIRYDPPAFGNAEELRAAFEEAEISAHEAAAKKFKAEGDLILYVAKIQSYLSERGANAHLRKAAGMPAGFERWYTDFRARYDVEFAFKTMQHKIAQLQGGCEHCGRLAENDADHKKSCILYRPLIELAEPEDNVGRTRLDMKEVTNAHYADRYLNLIGLLTSAPKETSAEQIIATMRAEAESAYEDLDAEMAGKIKIPKLVAVKSDSRIEERILEQEAANLEMEERIALMTAEHEHIVGNLQQRLETLNHVPENLRDETITGTLTGEPDRGRAGLVLADYLTTVVSRVLPPHMTLKDMSIAVQLAGRDHRIVIGDYLEKRNSNTAERKKTLAKCTAIAEYEQRRRVQEWLDDKWGKEHVLYNGNEIDYVVITEAAAQVLAPEAFAKSKAAVAGAIKPGTLIEEPTKEEL